MRNNQIFKNDFVEIHHLCKISSQIIQYNISAPYDFHAMDSL